MAIFRMRNWGAAKKAYTIRDVYITSYDVRVIISLINISLYWSISFPKTIAIYCWRNNALCSLIITYGVCWSAWMGLILIPHNGLALFGSIEYLISPKID